MSAFGQNPAPGRRRAITILSVAACCLTAWLSPAAAQPVEPAPFLELDVPYVPTPDDVVSRMLRLADVGPADFLIDLGSGDGRIPITAVQQRNVKGALGVEIVPDLVEKARRGAEAAGVQDRVEFRVQNLFDTDFSRATVLTMYLLPDVNMALRPRILSELAPGTRVVSHEFDLGDWESDDSDHLGQSSLYLWIVPANVQGQWLLDVEGQAEELRLEQRFQRLSGVLVRNGRELPLESGNVRGSDVQFSVRDRGQVQQYLGRVAGDALVGLSVDPQQRHWRGTRPMR